MKLFGFLWVLSLGAVLGYLAWTAGFLPGHLAVHFDAAGRSNGFQSKDSFLASFDYFVLAINGLFGLLNFFIGRLPESWVHFPRKDYWFSTPERKAEALKKISGILFLVGSFSNFSFFLTVQVIYQENVKNPILTMPLGAGVFLGAGAVVLTLFCIFVFRKPPAEG